jgi:hypothetical protein
MGRTSTAMDGKETFQLRQEIGPVQPDRTNERAKFVMRDGRWSDTSDLSSTTAAGFRGVAPESGTRSAVRARYAGRGSSAAKSSRTRSQASSAASLR